MTARFDALTRPKAGDDPRTNSKYLKVGLVLATLDLMVAMVTLIVLFLGSTALSQLLGNASDTVVMVLVLLG